MDTPLIYVSPIMEKRTNEFLKWWAEKIKGPMLTKAQVETIYSKMKFPEDGTRC